MGGGLGCVGVCVCLLIYLSLPLECKLHKGRDFILFTIFSQCPGDPQEIFVD